MGITLPRIIEKIIFFISIFDESIIKNQVHNSLLGSLSPKEYKFDCKFTDKSLFFIRIFRIISVSGYHTCSFVAFLRCSIRKSIINQHILLYIWNILQHILININLVQKLESLHKWHAARKLFK